MAFFRYDAKLSVPSAEIRDKEQQLVLDNSRRIAHHIIFVPATVSVILGSRRP
jgi:hypothetical protein